jgi:hypothetical protein
MDGAAYLLFDRLLLESFITFCVEILAEVVVEFKRLPESSEIIFLLLLVDFAPRF